MDVVAALLGEHSVLTATSDGGRTPEHVKTHRLRGELFRFAIGAEQGMLRDRRAGGGRAAKTLVAASDYAGGPPAGPA